jgi:hypothetical protein
MLHPGHSFVFKNTKMVTIKHYINKSKGDHLAVWLMTALLVIAGLPWLKNFTISVLIKLYELFVQDAIGK